MYHVDIMFSGCVSSITQPTIGAGSYLEATEPFTRPDLKKAEALERALQRIEMEEHHGTELRNLHATGVRVWKE